MKRKLCYLAGVVLSMNCLFLIESCSRDNEGIGSIDNTIEVKNGYSNNLYSERDLKLLKAKYNFISVTAFDASESISANNKMFSKSTEQLIKYDLDLNSANVINWGDKVSIIIKFKNNDNKFILVNSDDTENIDLNKGLIVETIVTGYKKGKVIISDSNGNETIDFIDNGNVSTMITNNGAIVEYAGKNKFRECLDKAYDDICDGPIGCTAWYANPLVPLTAIAYCTAKTM